MGDQRDSGRFQFSLRSLFWFVTVVAVLCASYACANRVWGDSGAKAWLVIAFLFWPSLAALIVWTCPDTSFACRVGLYGIVGAGITVTLWISVFSREGLGEAILVASVGTFVMAFVLWAPQSLVVFAVATYAIERSRNRIFAEADAGLRPQPNVENVRPTDDH